MNVLDCYRSFKCRSLCLIGINIFAVASTCRKEQVREYYTENDCRSRQPLKYAKCVGGCGNQCCAAKVVRRRKVRMVCSNNAKYVKNLDIVRKCGCTKKCY